MSNVLSGFRRSKRVLFEMPVEIYAFRENEEPIFEVGRTLSVNAHGGLLALTTPVALGDKLRLINPQTRQEIECRVGRIGMRYPSGVTQAGIEFVTVSPTFWNIASPPADWDPAWVPPAPRERPARPEPPLSPESAGEGPQKRVTSVHSNDVHKAIQEGMRWRPESRGINEDRTEPTGWRFRSWPTFVLAGLMGLIFLFVAMSNRMSLQTVPAVSLAIPDLAPEHARLIPGIENFRIARPDDFAPVGVSWMANSGQQASAEISGDFSAFGQSNAYILRGKDGMWRIVILADGKLRCDAHYRTVAIVARVDKEARHKIVWATPPPADAEGDGLLVVRSVDDLGSAVVLFLRGDDVVSATPSGSWQIPLN